MCTIPDSNSWIGTINTISSMSLHAADIVHAIPTTSTILLWAAIGKRDVIIGCSENLIIISTIIGLHRRQNIVSSPADNILQCHFLHIRSPLWKLLSSMHLPFSLAKNLVHFLHGGKQKWLLQHGTTFSAVARLWRGGDEEQQAGEASSGGSREASVWDVWA